MNGCLSLIHTHTNTHRYTDTRHTLKTHLCDFQCLQKSFKLDWIIAEIYIFRQMFWLECSTGSRITMCIHFGGMFSMALVAPKLKTEPNIDLLLFTRLYWISIHFYYLFTQVPSLNEEQLNAAKKKTWANDHDDGKK